jgi:hypothetical protein
MYKQEVHRPGISPTTSRTTLEMTSSHLKSSCSPPLPFLASLSLSLVSLSLPLSHFSLITSSPFFFFSNVFSFYVLHPHSIYVDITIAHFDSFTKLKERNFITQIF